MNRKLILVLSIAIAGLMALGASSALAVPQPCPPNCGGGDPPNPAHLYVNSPSLGTVDSDPAGIHCGGAGATDCDEDYTYCFDCEPQTVTLTAHSVPAGYTARFSTCSTSSTTSCVGGGSGTFCGISSCDVEVAGKILARLAVADESPPSKPSITGPPNNRVGPSAQTFSATSSDTAGVSRIDFIVDGGAPVSDASAPFQYLAGGLSEGGHTLTAFAYDAGGNQSPVSDTTSFTVDKTANVAITAGPVDGGHYHTVPALSFTHDSDPAAGGIVCQTYKGGTLVDSVTCDGSYAPVTSTDGEYVALVQFTDDVGNQATQQRAFTLDTGEPNVTITSPHPGQNDHVASPFTPTYTVSDGFTPTDALDVKCKVNNDDYGACTSLQASDGFHTLFVKATDQAGNFHVESVGFTVDSTGPQVTINSGPPEDAIITSASATYGWTVTDASTPLAQTCKLDTGAAAACTSPKTFNGLSEGSHTFTLRVTDALGNATEVTRELFVNAVRPSVTITSGPAEGAVLKSKSVTFGFRPAGGGTVTCSLDSETAYRPCSGATSDTLSNLADGAHTFRVRVKDQSDDTAVASRAFAVDTSVAPPPPPPLVDILNPSLSTRYTLFSKYTRYKRLVLKRVPAGSTITVKCKGKKCPAKSFHKKGHGTVKLSKFAKKKLRPGTKLTIRVTKPGTIGKQFVILIRKGKAPKLTISQIA